MNIREFVVKIQKVFVLCAVANNGGRKLFAAVKRVIKSKGKLSFAFYLFGTVYIVNLNKIAEIIKES